MGLQLAQVNIALPKEPVDSPLLADFAAALEPINALADSSPGFVWRLQTDEGDATSIRAFEDERLIINMSVWETIDDLWCFVYDGRHLEVMRRRREWFERIEIHMALWWIPSGHIPGIEEARERIEQLARHGPTEHAFTFKRRFPPPGEEAVDPSSSKPLAGCPAD